MTDKLTGPWPDSDPCLEPALSEQAFAATVLAGDAPFLYHLYLGLRADRCGKSVAMPGFTDAQLLAFAFSGHHVPTPTVPASIPLPGTGWLLIAGMIVLYAVNRARLRLPPILSRGLRCLGG